MPNAGSQEISSVLQKADIPLISQDKCKQLYKASITDRMFCAGYVERPIDSCSGDSGGPVAVKTRGISMWLHDWEYVFV